MCSFHLLLFLEFAPPALLSNDKGTCGERQSQKSFLGRFAATS